MTASKTEAACGWDSDGVITRVEQDRPDRQLILPPPGSPLQELAEVLPHHFQLFGDDLGRGEGKPQQEPAAERRGSKPE